ncbi:MAG TPA: FAD-dependent oxidoreductase [Candidatus Acidoferrales bacterium]|nr:FAD-dependent oxidoreductase [Candidatus Acidoferrales bacterium]
MSAKVAVAGAGIYGTNIAIRLAEQGHQVRLFDPLGILQAASAINQYRIHSGYHYPRSPETISETLEARAEFMDAFAPAIVRNSRHFYAIPHEGSQTPPELFEKVMAQYQLVCKPCRPEWMNFDFIAKCYEVDEQIYDPDLLRDVVTARIKALGISFEQRAFAPEMRDDYDFVVYATYGLGPSRGLFKNAKYQVAEKILIELPKELQHISLVVIDGPFTAFDPYGSTDKSLFGSAKNTNHSTTNNPRDPIPEPYAQMLNRPAWEKIDFSRFDAMRRDSMLAVPASKDAIYLGSRFTIRVVENNPITDRRTLYVEETSPREIHIFSGKVVGAVKAARLVSERIAKG